MRKKKRIGNMEEMMASKTWTGLPTYILQLPVCIAVDSQTKRDIYTVIGIYPCGARCMKEKECLANLRANLIKHRFYDLPGGAMFPLTRPS